VCNDVFGRHVGYDPEWSSVIEAVQRTARSWSCLYCGKLTTGLRSE
jgi:hypothetical protein